MQARGIDGHFGINFCKLIGPVPGATSLHAARLRGRIRQQYPYQYGQTDQHDCKLRVGLAPTSHDSHPWRSHHHPTWKPPRRASERNKYRQLRQLTLRSLPWLYPQIRMHLLAWCKVAMNTVWATERGVLQCVP